jgi:hypothetical protein
MSGLRTSLEIIGRPRSSDAEKHAQACDALYAPLPSDVTPSRTRYFEEQAQFATTSNEAAELSLILRKLFSAAYADQWRTIEFLRLARAAWERGCLDAAEIRRAKPELSDKLLEACASSPGADDLRAAAASAISMSGEP